MLATSADRAPDWSDARVPGLLHCRGGSWSRSPFISIPVGRHPLGSERPSTWIVGAGAVGLGLGSALLAGGATVGFVARDPTLAALRASGLSRSGLFGRVEHPASSFRSVADPREIPYPVGQLLVATKSFDSASVAQSLVGAPCVGPDTRIVLCQNGWGLADRFRPFFAERSIWNARVITGFRRPALHHVEITVHAEPVRIGSLFGEPGSAVAGLCRSLTEGGLPSEPTDTIARDLWAKLLYNGLLNPLGALFEVPYGELPKHPEIRDTMRELALETFAVMRAAGHETHWPDADAYLEDFYARLLPPTARHESSTLQDLRAGRRTEIDALTGAVVRLGEEHGTPTPVSRTLLAMIHFIEARNRGPSPA